MGPNHVLRTIKWPRITRESVRLGHGTWEFFQAVGSVLRHRLNEREAGVQLCPLVLYVLRMSRLHTPSKLQAANLTASALHAMCNTDLWVAPKSPIFQRSILASIR